MTDDIPLFSRSGHSNTLGKCTEEVKTLLPPNMKELLTALAVFNGQSLSEYVRDQLIKHLYGHAHAFKERQRNGNDSGQE